LLAIALQQHGDTAALEVEGHLVELAPAGGVGRAVRQDGVSGAACGASMRLCIQVQTTFSAP
jgi:hypothetical protein